MDPDWWTPIESLMRAHPGAGERLIVEITETVAIQDIDDIRGFVTRLKNFGSQIAIDDFGAGYTSFRNLRKLGVDIVKIDGAFVQNIARSADDRAFVQTLIDLARRLQIKTVAEWVQDEEAAVMLREWGCDYIQGRLIGLASPERPWSRRRRRCCRRRVDFVATARTPGRRRREPREERTTLPSSALSTCARGGPACPSSGGEGRRYCLRQAPAPAPSPARSRSRRGAAARTA